MTEVEKKLDDFIRERHGSRLNAAFDSLEQLATNPGLLRTCLEFAFTLGVRATEEAIANQAELLARPIAHTRITYGDILRFEIARMVVPGSDITK